MTTVYDKNTKLKYNPITLHRLKLYFGDDALDAVNIVGSDDFYAVTSFKIVDNCIAFEDWLTTPTNTGLLDLSEYMYAELDMLVFDEDGDCWRREVLLTSDTWPTLELRMYFRPDESADYGNSDDVEAMNHYVEK